MKVVSDATVAAWRSGDYTGDARPLCRVTVQKLNVLFVPYDLAASQITSTTAKDRTGKFTSVCFGQQHRPVELPNLRSVRWSRSVDEPVASATFEFYNTAPLPLGETPVRPAEFDQPGYYTFSRGGTSFSWRFGHVANGWRDLLVPDRLLRSWEGYGFDPTVAPEDDPSMYPSGLWLIDEVLYTSEGMITVTARDVGRVLVDQICFPPVIPWAEYPLYWDAFHEVKDPDTVRTVGSDRWERPAYHSDSNVAWLGSAAHHGHHGRDAFDGNPNSYFLSVGNSHYREPYAYEYVQGRVSGPVAAVKVHAFGGPYTAYISVMVNGRWQGGQNIPYNRAGVGRNNTNIPFVAATTVGANGVTEIRLPQTYAGAQYVRVTLGGLWNSGIGPYRYRGAIRTVEAFITTSRTITQKGPLRTVGNFGDYSDIVKWFLAWSGFYWPQNKGTASRSYLTRTDGTREYLLPTQDDPVLGKGRVWGDIWMSGTTNYVVDVDPDDPSQGQITSRLDIDVWDKKPILDCIIYIRDILGTLFYIDETGGAVFRPPNIWAVGNYISNPTGGPAASRTSTVVEIDEKQTLITLTSALNSRNVRERVFVSNESATKAAVSAGFNPYPSGLRRVGGWSDLHFDTVEQCQRMADLITLRQMFTYRENQLTIAANPQLQVDDQVRIYEATTGEGYIHRIKSIESTWDVESGEWLYQLTTHWLGESPFDRWAFDPYDPNQLSPTTLDYLRATGVVA